MIHDIASQIVGIIGLVSNGLSMLIFYRQRVHKIFHNLLLTLAIFDTESKFALGLTQHVSAGLRPGVHEIEFGWILVPLNHLADGT